MPAADQSAPFSVTLISMPWSIFNRPSLQLAALKAYLEREMSVRVELCHPYLDVAKALGIDTYRRISKSGWAGEALFAGLLFPDRREQAAKVFRQSLKDTDDRRKVPNFDGLVALIETTCRDWLAQRSFQESQLIGLSVCFNQLFSSLYVATLLKQQHLTRPIVFGGSSCAGKIGHSLQKHFPQIDYIVDGEGEGPLLGLCSYLAGQAGSLPDRLHTQKKISISPCPELADLNLLPIPDYSPYFSEMQRLFPEQPFIPILPLEFSRGCWWNKCTFCNLNIQWQGYRHKTADRVAAEVETLSQTYQCLDFTFADNALPIREADHFFQHRAQTGTDCRFFAEIRGTTDPDRLHIYSRGGLRTIQVGIEALSTSLLGKMAKGVTTIENIAVMKHSAACSIRLEGNLILEFPGSNEEEVSETLATLDFVLPYTPLSPAVFFLGHGSPVHRDPQKFGINTLIPHKKNRLLFPPELLTGSEMLSMGYRGDRKRQHLLWRQVAGKIKRWQQFHAQRPKNSGPPLSYRDGGSFLIIRQERPDGPPLQHRLRGISRQIYLFCEQIRTKTELQERFSSFSTTALDAFLAELIEKRLLFQEYEQIIALAIPWQSP